MKKVFIYFLAALVSCKNIQGSENLEGTYTAYHEHEFGKTHDTLFVRHVNDGDNIYSIIRHSGVVRTADGKIFPKKVVEESYMARYNERDKILDELKTGKIFIYNSQKQTLLLGKTAFLKNKVL